jgi:hypothetical protein
VTDIEIVDMTEMAAPPEPAAATDGEALSFDFGPAINSLSKVFDKAGRIQLADGEDAQPVHDRLKASALEQRLPISTYQTGSLIYFYVNGPQPDMFLKQYRQAVGR